MQQTLTTRGLNDLPLVEELCLVQRTLAVRGLNDLPLVGGLCLVQWTSTTKGLNDLPLIRGLCLIPMMDLTMMGHKIQTGANQGEQRRRQSIERIYYLEEGGRFCVEHLVDARMITALGC
jgi:hypothetical protein